jgi:8-oxo-dGTP pyrophosphatase MutT (NUDIX family)
MQFDINHWKSALKNPLGLEAQLLMAPNFRVQELEDYANKSPKSQSAVLVLLYQEAGDLKLLLTLRSSNLAKHAGQISFPGGKQERQDLDLVQTALREAEEEVGIKAQEVEIIGRLSPLLIPVNGYEVHPMVAYCAHKPVFKIDPQEVAQLIEVDISHLLDTDNIKIRSFESKDRFKLKEAPYFRLNQHQIWGATAMMIAELLIILFPESKLHYLWQSKKDAINQQLTAYQKA